ncbi:hypothetical protein ACFVS2_25165 [Brevibacillus sp. NPDC058079]|uniref:hypothetical protein n=1 Tax=Brevibacillus sp. NPDC058079 TaxID=3346330 RepID=UPI0036F1039C
MEEKIIDRIILNGEIYLKKTDVDRYYTQKDKIKVDNIVLEEAIKKMPLSDLVTFVTSIARDKLREVGSADLSEIMDTENGQTFAINQLLMIANVGRL